MNILRRSFKALIPGFLLSLGGCSGPGRNPPALVVYVSVDQLRGDLLEHYDSLFTGGFRRLHDDGFRFTQATHDHATTATAVGHTTLGTGSFPSHHGVVGNNWLERTPDGWRSVYSYEDTLVHILGQPTMEGRSPKNNQRQGLADWIQDADTAAIIASISRKDRAAIGMASKANGHVYWITEAGGQFVTSSFYAQAYPSWVERFNREVMPRIFGDSIWEETLTPSQRSATRRDTVEYEGDGVHTYFPHSFREESGDPERVGALNRWAYGQTHPDAAVAAFAMEAVKQLGMGQDDVTDYLGLSFSQTDAIGHKYGPMSREQLENLMHLDHALGTLMNFLDETVGEGRWLMALSADHGVMDIPEYLAEEGAEGSRPTRDELRALRTTFSTFESKEGDPQEVAEELAEALKALPIVGDAVTASELLSSGPPADSFRVFMRNSYNPDRWQWGYGSQGSGVVFRLRENMDPDVSPRGTTHGSPYYYDRFVPLIFFGSSVEAGTSASPVRTVDIAPTLAVLAGIPIPTDLDGVPLLQ